MCCLDRNSKKIKPFGDNSLRPTFLKFLGGFIEIYSFYCSCRERIKIVRRGDN